MKVSDYVEIREDPTVPLFHYTSVGPLVEILASGKLWATDVQYMNDASELQYGIQLLDQALLPGSVFMKDKKQKCALQLRQWLSNGRVVDHHTFVASFTEKGNLLSQWRGYCAPQKGVSIGFSPDELIDCSARQNFQLAKVMYSREEQNVMVSHLLDSLFASLETFEEPGPDRAHPEQSYFSLFEEWALNIIYLCAIIKHPSFCEEAEWRAIAAPISNLRDKRLQYRDASLTLTPYMELELPTNASNGVSLEQVFMGPSSNHRISFRAISSLLTARNAFPRNGLHSSDIPLR